MNSNGKTSFTGKSSQRESSKQPTVKCVQSPVSIKELQMFTQTDIIKEIRETPISEIESAVIAGNVTANKSATEN